MPKFKVGDVVKFNRDDIWNRQNPSTIRYEGFHFDKEYIIEAIYNRGEVVAIKNDTGNDCRWMKERFQLVSGDFNFDNFEVKAWNRYAKQHLLT